MTNCLDMRCPNCGRTDQIDIHARVWVRLTSDGTATDIAACGDHEWDDDTLAGCSACSHAGPVKSFAPAEGGAA